MEWKSTPAAIWAAALWYTLLGGFLAAFAFWQSLTAGIAFAAVWLLLGLWLLLVVLPTWRVRMTPRELEVSVGVLFPILHRMPRLTVCGLQRVTTPVLRRAGLCLAWVHGAGPACCRCCPPKIWTPCAGRWGCDGAAPVSPGLFRAADAPLAGGVPAAPPQCAAGL